MTKYINQGGQAFQVADEVPELIGPQPGNAEVTGAQAAATYTDQVQEAQAEKDTPPALSAVMGLNSGLTFGLSDALTMKGLQAFGGTGKDGEYTPEDDLEYRGIMRGIPRANPYAHGVGTAAGMALGLLTGSTESRIASPWGAVEGAGNLAERLATRSLPVAESALGRVGVGAAKFAARGAAEGALISTMENISNQALSNKPFSAEALAAAAGDGALFGGAFGAGLGGAGALAGEAASATKGAIGRALRGASEGEGEIGSLVKRKADEYLTKRIGGSVGDLESMEAKHGGNFLKKADQLLSEDGLSITSEAKEINAASSRLARRSSEAIIPAAREIDSVAGGMKPSYSRFAQEVNEKILPEFAGTRPDVVRAVNKFTKSLQNGTEDFAGWAKRATQMGDQIGGEGLAANAKQRVAKLFREEFARSASEAAEMSPAVKEAFGKYQAANATFAIAKDLEGMTKGAKAQATLMGRTVDAVKTIGPWAVFNPAVAAKVVAAKVATGMFADAALPTIAKMVSGLERTQEIASRTSAFRAKIQQAAKGFVTGAKAATKATSYAALVKASSTREGYDKLYSRAVDGVSDVRRAQVAQVKGGDMQEAIAGLHGAAATYLQAAMPPDKKVMNAISLRNAPSAGKLSMQEHAFVRKAVAVMHPESVLDDLEAGNVSADAIDAIKNVYPEMYNELQQSARETVMDAKAKGDALPFTKVAKLSIMFQTPLDPMLEPQYVNAVQGAFQPEAKGPGRPRNSNAANQADAYEVKGGQ